MVPPQPVPAPAPELGGIVGWVVDLMNALGGPGVALAIALENLFPPLPSEVFLPLAGFAAARGELDLVAAIVWSTVGSVVGALALYGIGRALGRRRMHALADRIPLIKVADLERAEGWFRRHGRAAVFFGRMVPMVRSLISVPAGIERMPLVMFVIYTALGSAIWNSGLITAGYLLGERWQLVQRYTGAVGTALLVAAGLAACWFVITRLRQRTRQR